LSKGLPVAPGFDGLSPNLNDIHGNQLTGGSAKQE
jgi:hypothetical protein